MTDTTNLRTLAQAAAERIQRIAFGQEKLGDQLSVSVPVRDLGVVLRALLDVSEHPPARSAPVPADAPTREEIAEALADDGWMQHDETLWQDDLLAIADAVLKLFAARRSAPVGTTAEAAADRLEALEEESFKHRPVLSMHDGSIAGCRCMDRVFIKGSEDYDSHIAEAFAALEAVSVPHPEPEPPADDAELLDTIWAENYGYWKPARAAILKRFRVPVPEEVAP